MTPSGNWKKISACFLLNEPKKSLSEDSNPVLGVVDFWGSHNRYF